MNETRLARVLEHMARQGLSQIVVTSTASVYYLTGYWVEPMERMLALYLRDDGTRTLYANELFGLAPQPGLALELHRDGDDPAAALAAALRPGTLGVDKAWPSKFLISLLGLRPDVAPVPGSAPVDEARRIKDADEIAAMRAASQINDQVMAAAVAALGEGAVEADIAALVEAQYRAHGGERSSEGVIVSFGPNGADPHHAPGRTVLRDGDSVVLDLFTPIRRYWCDMTRTVFFRSADGEGRRVYEAVRAANLAAEAVIRPGVPMCDIDRAARRVIEDAGYGPCFTHRLGHGCGLDCHEPPDNSAACRQPAEPGMVFSVEPGIYLPGRLGVRIEDLVLVTPDGCEVLNAETKDLRVVGL
ncbi:proline dipeptidase [Oscillospiraceae bacterium]|nr:proline dipeptidase [Oscillospiraceae bacterium]BDF75930.1 proline dipeptidase [Oscillospiraceae bacterium]